MVDTAAGAAAPATPCWMRRSKARKRSTASATARTTWLSRAAKGLHGTIAIRPGDRIPLIPRHTLKAFVDCQVTSRLSLDVNVVAASGVFARGNENNASQPDGTYYLGPGATPAYGIANFGGQFQLTRRVQMLAQINNLLDRRYYTAAQLGPTGFTATGQYIARALPAIQGQFPVAAIHLLCAGRAGGLLDRNTDQVLKAFRDPSISAAPAGSPVLAEAGRRLLHRPHRAGTPVSLPRLCKRTRSPTRRRSEISADRSAAPSAECLRG